MNFPRKRGSTSVLVRTFIPDNSVTTGAGLPGLVCTSANLAIAYGRELQNGFTQITGTNLTTVTTVGLWADPGTGKAGFGPVDATNAPGLYEIHFPDDAAAFGAGDLSQSVIINVLELTTTALNIRPNMCFIPLVPWDYQDGQRMGLTALPAAGVTTINSVWTDAKAGFLTGDAYTSLTAAQSEPGQGAPAANASVVSKIAYMFKGWRNKGEQTNDTHSIYNDAGSTVDHKATVSDDGTTFTRGKMGTGA